MTLGLGIVGLGTAGAAMLAAALHRTDLRLSAIADPRVDALGVPGLDGVRRYASLDGLLSDDGVHIVHIATPTPLHAEHVARGLAAGRHVIVEKPVTTDSDSARHLAATAAGRDEIAVVGHSESFEPYVSAAQEVIADREIGQPAMVIAEKVTDWMRRPRLLEELESGLGGGLIRRQGVHQVDVVRTLVGGRFEVRAARTRPDPERGVAGSFTAWLDAEDGPGIVISHDGVGRRTRGGWAAGTATVSVGDNGSGGEGADKRLRSLRLLKRAITADGALTLGLGDEERILVLGTEGELTASRHEVAVTGDGGRRTVALGSRPSGRDAVLDEVMDAISGRRAPVHDLAWGAENLRLCEEIERVATANSAMEMKGSQ